MCTYESLGMISKKSWVYGDWMSIYPHLKSITSMMASIQSIACQWWHQSRVLLTGIHHGRNAGRASVADGIIGESRHKRSITKHTSAPVAQCTLKWHSVCRQSTPLWSEFCPKNLSGGRCSTVNDGPAGISDVLHYLDNFTLVALDIWFAQHTKGETCRLFFSLLFLWSQISWRDQLHVYFWGLKWTWSADNSAHQ